MRQQIQKFGRALSGMVMPNIGAFIAWGFVTALFIPSGWWPNTQMARLVDPMLTYLLPLLIAYTAGRNVAGERGGVIGAIAAMGVIVGSDIPMFIGAMVMGPLGGYTIRWFDKLTQGRIKAGFEMLVSNFSIGILGMLLAILGYWVIGGAVTGLTLLVSKKVLNDALIPIAKENWQQIGVLLKPQVVDFNALMAQRKAGNYDLASFSTSTLNDPHDGVWDFYSTEAKESGYNNPQVDKLINAGNAVLDIEKRKPIYHQLYKVLADDPPVILLGYRNILSASSARVTGFKPDIYNGLTGSLPDVKIVK